METKLRNLTYGTKIMEPKFLPFSKSSMQIFCKVKQPYILKVHFKSSTFLYHNDKGEGQVLVVQGQVLLVPF